jgi:hypothetical protein
MPFQKKQDVDDPDILAEMAVGAIGRFVMRLASKMVGDARSFFVFEDHCELLVVFLRRRYAITVSSAELSDAYRTLFTAERIGEFPLFETLRERFAN